MKSIPASRYANVIPSVLAAGGNPLALNGVFVDTSGDTSIPIGTVKAFPSPAAVEAWYGPNAIQSLLAGFYFGGFLGADTLPSNLYIAQYNSAPVAGYLRGGNISALSLTQLQAFSGSLTIVIDGVSHVSAAINLSSATSFSNAATLITAGLAGGTPTSAAVCTYDSLRGAFVITSSTTGASSTVAFPTTATLATDLLLTSATGAVLSAGAVAATPAGTMNAIVAVTQNWATFTTTTDPDAGSEPATIKLGFAAWVSSQSPAGEERFAYAGWDADPAPAAGTAAASFGAAVTTAGYNGVVPIWDIASSPSAPGVASNYIPGSKAAFFCGAAASIDYTETQGRITFDFKNGPGLIADVVDSTTANNLESNGYNYYGQSATANQQFTFFQPGSMPGSWKWADDYIDQIWLNQGFQLAIMLVLTTFKSIPYNNAGYAIWRAGLMGQIIAAVNAGVIQPNIPLSPTQVAAVNTAAGSKIDGVLSTVGWYLQILPADPTTRGNRQSPPMKFWYTDGGSIQSVVLDSIDVQ